MNAPEKQRTRARVVELLRRNRCTVDELARSLGVTDNAVRMHLTSLEDEGIVRAEGVRRSGQAGKPAVIYEIAPDAEPLFSRVYAPMLGTLVETLSERLSAAELEEVFREVGRRMAATMTPPPGVLAKRVRAVSVVLNQMGGLTTVEANNGTVILRGGSCPLSVAVSRRPEVCKAVEEMLSVLVGAEVEQQCTHTPRPSCCFALSEAHADHE